MGNSCKSVFPNTRAWEQQERNKIKKQTKKRDVNMERSKAGTKIFLKGTAYHYLIKIQ